MDKFKSIFSYKKGSIGLGSSREKKEYLQAMAFMYIASCGGEARYRDVIEAIELKIDSKIARRNIRGAIVDLKDRYPVEYLQNNLCELPNHKVIVRWHPNSRYIKGNEYKRMNDFKKRVLDLAINEINENFDIRDLKGPSLPVYNIDHNQKRPFEKISTKSNKYILKCFDSALKFSKNKKILGFINCPISKESLFKNKYQGITEFLSKKAGVEGKEVMLIYNKKLSVSPLTTHIPLREVNKKINKTKIINKVKTIRDFYKKNFNKNPCIGVLGLNPHNFVKSKKKDETKIIHSAIKKIKKMKIKILGPISPDTSFMFFKKYRLDVIFGMYHDQVLTPFKALFKHNAINITLGLPYIRISPDHGVAENIIAKNIADPKSLIESIKFFNYIK